MAATMETTLSDLPEEIIHHIFSYIDDLTNHKALGLSKLSKQLHRAIQKRPALVFDGVRVSRESEAEIVNKYEQELNHMHSTLERYHRENISLETFTLKTANWHVFLVDRSTKRRAYENIYNQCNELAAKNGLTNLLLWMNSADYVIPQHVLKLKSLVKLNLRSACLMSESIAWPNLKQLSIDGCVASEEVFKNIVIGCPSLEYLKANIGWFAGIDFKVANLHNLKQLDFVIGKNQRLEVDSTPNLESIKCDSFIKGIYASDGRYFFGFGGTEYPNLKSLEMTCGQLDKSFFINFEGRFPMLEKLHLTNCNALEGIDLSSNSVKEIKLVDNRELQHACFDVPNLVHFEYHNCCFKVPKLTLAGNSGRWSSCIKLAEFTGVDDASTRFLELHEFLAELNMSETSIDVELDGSVLFSDHALPPIADFVPAEIREFYLSTSLCEISPSLVSAILDAIFSIYRPQTMTFNIFSTESAKLFYEKLVSRNERRSKRFHHYHSVADFEMFGKSGEARFRIEDWDKLVEVLEKEKSTTHISFQLKY